MNTHNIEAEKMETIQSRIIPNPSIALPCHCDFVKEKLLPDILSEIAMVYPNDVAIEAISSMLTYAELDKLVAGFAGVLLQAGVHKNQAVFIYANRCPLLVITILAVLKTGASFTLLDPSDPLDYLEICIDTVSPTTWIDLSDKAEQNQTELAALDKLVNQKFKINYRLFSIDDLKNVIDASDIILDRLVFPFIEGNDTATITFTSGSSGKPKAVMGRFSSLSHFQEWMRDEFTIGKNDRFAMCSNLSHDPIQRDIFTAICLGATIVVPTQQDIFTSGQLPQWMHEKNITVCCLTPPMCQFLTAYNINAIKLNHMRKIFFVGSSLLKMQVESLQQVAPNAEIINLYGSTESQRAVSYFNASQYLAGLPDIVPIGHGMKDVDILIVDQVTGKICDFGEVGEIWIRSPYIAKGYLNAPSKDVFAVHPFSNLNNDFIYKTGDLGRYSGRFGVHCLGRIDNQIKIDGHRVEPSQIDNTLMHYKMVKNAITLGIINPIQEYKLVTFLVLTKPENMLEKETVKREIRHFVGQRLPNYMIPKRIIFLDAIPLTKNGKIDVGALTQLANNSIEEKSTAGDDSSLISISDLSTKVAKIARIPANSVDIHTPLSDLGFSSLEYLELSSSIKKSYDITLPFFKKMPSIMEIIQLTEKIDDKKISYTSQQSEKDIPSKKILGDEYITSVSPSQININGKKYLHFCSNSYLGLDQHHLVRKTILDHVNEQQSINSHGAMELNGRTNYHMELLDQIKSLYVCSEVLLFNSAYMANISIIPALADKNDHIFLDSSSHKSLIDGCTLAQSHFYSFRHNDMEHLEEKLSATQNSSGQKFIITEGLFSMEGDILNLPHIRQLADKYSAILIVDEACSLGQLGFNGAGVESHFAMPNSIDCRTGTLSKAVPSVGGYAALSTKLLRQIESCRGAVFSGAIPPLQARIAAEALKILKNDSSSLITKLKTNIQLWRKGLEDLGLHLLPGESAITAIKTRSDDETIYLSELFLKAGVYVFPAIAPWNSKGKSLIRTSVTAQHTKSQIELALHNLSKHIKSCKNVTETTW